MDRRQPPLAVDILSDDDDDGLSPSPPPLKKRLERGASGGGGGGGGSPPVLVLDDDPTPQKPTSNRTPCFVLETPSPFGAAFDSDASIVKCTLSRRGPGTCPSSSDKFPGITGLICLESDNESEDGSHKENLKERGTATAGFGLAECSEKIYSFPRLANPTGRASEEGNAELWCSTQQALLGNIENNSGRTFGNFKHGSLNECNGTTNFIQIVGDSPLRGDSSAEDVFLQVCSYDDEEHIMSGQVDSPAKRKGKRAAVGVDKNQRKNEEIAKKQQLKEEKLRLNEERKRKRQQEKLQKEALKAEAAELKKLQKEKQKWEKGKFAIKSIVAEVDAKVVENGSVGGHLLARFAEKGLSFRITSNPFEGSILWKMTMSDQIAQLSSIGSEVPYVLLVYQAEEFCRLATDESLIDHVRRVRSRYPSFTICYLTNKLMSYINKCEQSQYKNPSNGSWRRPPIEEVLSKLTTHFTRVHSRQCIDEAELAEHVVGLTYSLATCQFRTKMTPLSVNANGALIPKDCIDKHMIKKNIWLKSLVAIPKVQPRFAIAISKKFPTMRSLLNVYMDPNKSVHEKEFLLKDLTMEGLLGNEDRRLGAVCSKRVYRILMAQSGGIKTDEVEDGADFFAANCV